MFKKVHLYLKFNLFCFISLKINCGQLNISYNIIQEKMTRL